MQELVFTIAPLLAATVVLAFTTRLHKTGPVVGGGRGFV